MFCLSFSERFKRALPPPYTQITNSRACMVAYQISASAAVCFPLEKPSGCSDSTWQDLGEAYGATKISPPSRIGKKFVLKNPNKFRLKSSQLVIKYLYVRYSTMLQKRLF